MKFKIRPILQEKKNLPTLCDGVLDSLSTPTTNYAHLPLKHLNLPIHYCIYVEIKHFVYPIHKDINNIMQTFVETKCIPNLLPMTRHQLPAG